jgi:hypothetical protein
MASVKEQKLKSSHTTESRVTNKETKRRHFQSCSAGVRPIECGAFDTSENKRFILSLRPVGGGQLDY